MGLQFFILIRYYMCPMIVVWRNVNQVSSGIIFLIFLRMDCRSELSVSFDHFCQSIGNLILVETNEIKTSDRIFWKNQTDLPFFIFYLFSWAWKWRTRRLWNTIQIVYVKHWNLFKMFLAWLVYAILLRSGCILA